MFHRTRVQVIDPKSLETPKGGRGRIASGGDETPAEWHSCLSRRGVAWTGLASATAWYCARLILRDVLGSAGQGSRTKFGGHLPSIRSETPSRDHAASSENRNPAVPLSPVWMRAHPREV